MLGSGYNTNAIGMAGRLRKTIFIFPHFHVLCGQYFIVKTSKKTYLKKFGQGEYIGGKSCNQKMYCLFIWPTYITCIIYYIKISE